QPIGVRMLHGLDHTTDAEQAQVAVLLRDAVALDRVDLGRGHREPVGELLQWHIDRHVVAQPSDGHSHQNCLSTRRPPSQSGRMSGKLWRSCATRSMPQPNAKPVHSLGSRPKFSNTRGSTIPEPPISSQPVYLHVRQPSPPQTPHETSGSIDGSVNGK